jgi:hypothetical protein
MTATLQQHALGLTWIEDGMPGRTAHAIVDGPRVWLIDPFDDEPALTAAASLGERAGVIQLLDRHNRDGAAIAQRLGVPHHRLPDSLPGSPFTVFTVIDGPGWKEKALWWPERKALVVAEAIGTAEFFALGRDAGVHPMLRLTPPRGRFAPYAPEVLLVGHGPTLETGAAAALSGALANARTDIPRFALALPSIIKAARG